MKKVLLAMVALLAFASCTSFSVNKKVSEQITTEHRSLQGFERIVQHGSMDVKYQQGDQYAVVVKTRKSDAGKVITRVNGNALVISMEGANKLVSFGWTDGDDVTVYVTSPDLIGVELNGSGDFECEKHLDTDTLDIALKGSGDIDFSDVICDHINVSVVGSGDVKVNKVKTQQTMVSLVGSGEVKINQEQVKQTSLELKGSGDVKVHCQDCELLKSQLMGSGDITLSGNVSVHDSSKQGSGDINVSRLTIQQK